MGRFDDTIFLIEVDGRNVDLVRRQADGFPEISPVALLLQFGIGDQPNGSVRPGTIGTNHFASAILNADDTKLRVGRLGLEFGQETRRDPLAPCRLGEAVDGIDAACLMRANEAVYCNRGPEAGDVAARAAHVGLQVGRDELRMRLDAIENARQQRLLQAAIAQPADRGDCDRNQQDHRERQSGRKSHCFRRA